MNAYIQSIIFPHQLKFFWSSFYRKPLFWKKANKTKQVALIQSFSRNLFRTRTQATRPQPSVQSGPNTTDDLTDRGFLHPQTWSRLATHERIHWGIKVSTCGRGASLLQLPSALVIKTFSRDKDQAGLSNLLAGVEDVKTTVEKVPAIFYKTNEPMTQESHS